MIISSLYLSGLWHACVQFVRDCIQERERLGAIVIMQYPDVSTVRNSEVIISKES